MSFNATVIEMYDDKIWISYGFYGCQLSTFNGSHQTSPINRAGFYIGWFCLFSATSPLPLPQKDHLLFPYFLSLMMAKCTF